MRSFEPIWSGLFYAAVSRATHSGDLIVTRESWINVAQFDHVDANEEVDCWNNRRDVWRSQHQRKPLYLISSAPRSLGFTLYNPLQFLLLQCFTSHLFFSSFGPAEERAHSLLEHFHINSYHTYLGEASTGMVSVTELWMCDKSPVESFALHIIL